MFFVTVNIVNIIHSYQLTVFNDSMWFDQKLDHFNSNDTRTWLQKYQIYCDHHNSLDPILLVIGPLDDDVFNIKLLTEEYSLIKLNSTILQIDQRYYSNSLITNDSTVDYLKYLNIEQEMEDIKTFKLYIQSKYQLTSSQKWILCGQGYAGSLAMGLRINNPDLFFAALSYRGSLTRKLVYTGFHDEVYKFLSNYDSLCLNRIIGGVRELQFSLESERGTQKIHEKFKLCDSPNKIYEKEKKQLLVSLRKSFVYAVQYNHSSKFNVKYVCDIMVNQRIGNSESRLAYLTLKKLEYDNLSCLKNSFDNVVNRKSTLSSELTVENEDHFEIVKKSLSDYNAECVSQIKDAEEKVVFNLSSVDRSTVIKNKFSLCEIPNKNSESSKQCIYENIRNLIDNAVMFNGYPNKRSIAHICNIMKNESIGTELDRMSKISWREHTYMDNNYSSYIYRHKLTSWDNTTSSDRQYSYQLCTEKGFLSTGLIDGDFCGQIFPKKYVENISSDEFEKSFNFSNLEKDIKNTKIKDNQILNIQVFSDPWHKQGLFENNLEYVDTILIEKYMYNTWRMAKTEIVKALKKWLPSYDEFDLSILFDDLF